MYKILIVGKMYSYNKNNGPSSVLSSLYDEVQKSEKFLDLEFLLLNESIGKLKFIYNVIKKVGFTKNRIINVHTDGYLIAFIIFLISKLNKRNRYYLTIHGVYLIESVLNKSKKKIYCILEKIIYKGFENIICVSEMLKANLYDIYGRDSNVYAISNGVSFQNIEGSERVFYEGKCLKLIFVGGFSVRKGIYDIINIVHALKKDGWNVKLDIFGKEESNDISKNVKKLISDYNLSNEVELHGMVFEKEKLYYFYNKADFNMCLSKYDTFNIAVLESMSVGCPCFVTETCGVSELLTNNTDSFVISYNSDYKKTIEAVLNKLLLQPELYVKMKKEAVNTALNSTWKKVLDDYLTCFNCNNV